LFFINLKLFLSQQVQIMKVLQVITSLSTGGAEKLIVDSVPLYQANGLAVDVLLLNGCETPLSKILKEETKGEVYNLSMGSVYNPFHIFKLLSYLKKYDIIHVHLFPTLYWVAVAKMIRFSRVKIIYTEHSTHNRRREKIIFKLLDKLMYNQYSKIITIADEVDKNLKEYLGLNPSRFELINNGANTKLFYEAIPYSKNDFFTEADKIIIQVSSFRPAKDQITLIKALLYLPENIKLLLVGEGELINECKNLVHELQLKDRILFLGVRMDVPSLLKTADIVVMSSVYEGLSLASIEGMASGKAFMASNVPGLREIVKGAGVLFEKGNEKQLADEIEKLLSDAEYYGTVAEKCLDRAKKYDIEKMIHSYMRTYKKVSES
jgi:glycosyltransferase involved in cell wall biosynthesis